MSIKEYRLAMPQRSSCRSQLIITADDFGRDAACTTAIADSLADGSITATSIMANASHFEQACALAHARGLLGKIGVHLCLDEGPALSPEMLRYADGNGQLCVRRSLKPFDRRLARAIATELANQIERVLEAGIRPTHLDSHRHIHTAFPIGRLVVELAQRYHIPYVRPARNLVSCGAMPVRMYKWMFNHYLAFFVKTADYFGDIVDFCRSEKNSRLQVGLIECMVHLDESPRGLDGRALLRSEEFKCFLKSFELVGHAEV